MSPGEPGINGGVERLLCDEMVPNVPCSAMQTTGLKEDLTTVYNYIMVNSGQGGRKGFNLRDSWHKKATRN